MFQSILKKNGNTLNGVIDNVIYKIQNVTKIYSTNIINKINVHIGINTIVNGNSMIDAKYAIILV